MVNRADGVVDHPDPLSHLLRVAAGVARDRAAQLLALLYFQVLVAAEAFEGSLLEGTVLADSPLIGQDDDDLPHLLFQKGQSLLDLCLFGLVGYVFVEEVDLIVQFVFLLFEGLLVDLQLNTLFEIFSHFLYHRLHILDSPLVDLALFEMFDLLRGFFDPELLFLQLT